MWDNSVACRTLYSRVQITSVCLSTVHDHEFLRVNHMVAENLSRFTCVYMLKSQPSP